MNDNKELEIYQQYWHRLLGYIQTLKDCRQIYDTAGHFPLCLNQNEAQIKIMYRWSLIPPLPFKMNFAEDSFNCWRCKQEHADHFIHLSLLSGLFPRWIRMGCGHKLDLWYRLRKEADLISIRSKTSEKYKGKYFIMNLSVSAKVVCARY